MRSLIKCSPFLLSAVLILCLSMPQTVLADNAVFDMVEQVAHTHMKAQIEFHKLHSEKSYGIQDNEYNILKIEQVLNQETEEILFYVAHLEPTGFIVISSNTDIRPVIFYSLENNFIMEDSPDNIALRMLIRDIGNRMEIRHLIPKVIIGRNNRLWELYLDEDPDFIRSIATTVDYGPLLDTQWGQGEPYNNLCPIDSVSGVRCPVGCTTTAMAQIINYWEYPPNITFSSANSYMSFDTDPPIWIDAEAASIDTIMYNDGFSEHPTAEQKAAISYAAAVSIQAQFGPEGTSAGLYALYYTAKWGYESAIYLDIDDDPVLFYDTFIEDVMAGKPVQISIHDTTGAHDGHSVVGDGYRDSGEFHLNYGWTGSSDGWYFMPDELPYGIDVVMGGLFDIVAPANPDAPDDCGSAIEISFEHEVFWHYDSISPEGDFDWFSFDVTDDSTYVFYTVGNTNTYGEIYSSCGGEILYENDDGRMDWNCVLEFLPIEEGSYYLKTRGSEMGIVGRYSLAAYKVGASFVQVTVPNGGEVIEESSMSFLNFAKGGIPSVGAVKLEYSISGSDGPWMSIVESTPNPTFFMWSVPDVDSTMRNCYIRVTSVDNEHVYDISDEAFTIHDPAQIDEIEGYPERFTIGVFPNPFNSSCAITVNVGAGSQPAQIEIFDLRGNVVGATPRGRPDDASENTKGHPHGDAPTNHTFIWQPDESISSGIYIIRAFIDGQTISKRAIYLK